MFNIRTSALTPGKITTNPVKTIETTEDFSNFVKFVSPSQNKHIVIVKINL